MKQIRIGMHVLKKYRLVFIMNNFESKDGVSTCNWPRSYIKSDLNVKAKAEVISHQYKSFCFEFSNQMVSKCVAD